MTETALAIAGLETREALDRRRQRLKRKLEGNG